MLKQRVCAALVAALCCLPAISDAATCRAAEAAQAGSRVGFERDKRAAEAWAERERSASDALQDCLSRIRTTTIRLPTFPNLEDLLRQASEQVCQAALEKVNGYIPDTIDPWEHYPG